MLKHTTVNALLWSFLEGLFSQGITFLFGILLARMLSPGEFGLMGIVIVCITVGQSITDSGFSQALIRKKHCTDADYSTVFFYNLLAAFMLYGILFFGADSIAIFFKEPRLSILIKVSALSLLLSGISIIHKTKLIKKLDFKSQARISLTASLLAGSIAVLFAWKGYGVWSLVINTTLTYTFSSLLLWLKVKWQPSATFDKNSFREMFSFGSNLLFAGIIDSLYRSANSIVIGRYFPAAQLGYYVTAEKFQSLPSQSIASVIQRVSYPVLSTLQENGLQLKNAYQKMITASMLLSFLLMGLLAAAAKNIVLVLLGEQWLPAVVYLQLLCAVGAFYPFHSLNLNVLKVKGRSDLFLRLEVFKKILAVPVIITGIFFGIKALIIAMIVNTLFSFYINSYWTGRFIDYPVAEQVKDILPSFVLAVLTGIAVYASGVIFKAAPLGLLCLQLLTGITMSLVLYEFFRLKSYLYVKELITEKIRIGL